MGREFGEGVRHAIKQIHLTHRELAEALDWDPAKLSDLVRGKGGVNEADVKQLLGYCRVKPDEVRRLLALFRESRENGYLQIPAQVHTLITQERLANAITVWSMDLIPGRLQTADYMRALVAATARSESIDYEEIIAAKLARRELFHWSRQYVFFVHEQALRLPVGGSDVMKDQLLHMLAMTQRSYIEVRIVPTSIGAHAGLAGSFTLLGYEKFEPVVYLESKNSSLFLEDAAILATYDEVLKLLDLQALDAEHSKELITSILI
ncbi:helix-turn-helix domain-containing protein [Lentzea miocenica]|uniref:helix-turn-helix domain-containing protein n=1 Tax=Lentzea miocenica TaxID=3095431 RepID=UPI0029F539AB|nr:helix-turn-helix transcriptional regulator [Lentzea sp. BCCO 10_0856]